MEIELSLLSYLISKPQGAPNIHSEIWFFGLLRSYNLFLVQRALKIPVSVKFHAQVKSKLVLKNWEPATSYWPEVVQVPRYNTYRNPVPAFF